MSDDSPRRSSISDELDVPDAQPDPASDDHILPLEELTYPTLTFETGQVTPETIELSGAFDRAGIQSILRDLDDALTSHDLCLAGPDRRAIFGLGPGRVDITFDPDDAHLGELEVTVRLKAKALDYADSDTTEVGKRGGLGFIPRAMLTGEIDPGTARCYNWIDDPTAGLDED